jgi:hypothetical protein
VAALELSITLSMLELEELIELEELEMLLLEVVLEADGTDELEELVVVSAAAVLLLGP